MNRLILFFIVWSIGLSGAQAQDYTGGKNVFTFLELPGSARSGALGKADIAYAFDASSVSWNNPALLSIQHHGESELNYEFFYAGIKNGTASYAHNLIDSNWMFQGGIQFVDYGLFQGRNIFDEDQGNFSAKDLAFSISGSYQLYDRLRLGLTAKFISSSYEMYHSQGIVLDLGAYYQKPGNLTSFGFVVKNLGTQLNTYYEEKGNVPLNVQLGVATRFEHLPLRFQFVYQYVNKWNLYHPNAEDSENPSVLIDNNAELTPFEKFSNNLLRHIGVSIELGLGEKELIYVRGSYNRQINRELGLEYRTAAGVGVGVGLNLRRIHLDYTYQIYHVAGGVNFIGLGFDFGGKKKPRETIID